MEAEDAVAAELGRLAGLPLDDLRREWGRRLTRPAPRCRSVDLLRGTLAWHIQAAAFGGLGAATRRRLRSLANAFAADPGHAPAATRDLKPGTLLGREWKGVMHQAKVLEDGFEYRGRHFASLSQVARSITGTQVSGPRFFGLVKRGPTRK